MLSLREIFPRKEFSETWPTNGLKNSKAPLSSHFTNFRSIIKIMIFKSASKRAIFLSRMWHTCQSHFQPTIWKPTCRSSYLCHKFNLTASLQGFQLGSLKKKKEKPKKPEKEWKCQSKCDEQMLFYRRSTHTAFCSDSMTIRNLQGQVLD